MTIKNKKRKINYKRVGILAISALVVFGLIYVSLTQLLKPGTNEPPITEPTIPPVTEEEMTTQLTLLTLGDLMFHQLQLDRAYQNGNYDFNENYQYISDTVKKADIAFTNFEGSINTSRPFAGYPAFNTPPEAIKAIANAGFDVLSSTNNHVLDSGFQGLMGTIDAIDESGMKNVGSSKIADEHPIVYVTKNDITVAFIAYAENFNGNETSELLTYVNKINQEQLKTKIEEAKSKSDFVVTYFHWGTEYASDANSFQKELAHNVVDWGADLVLGSHVHVVQNAEIIEKDGKKHYILYGMGNGISNQRSDTVDDLIGDRAHLTEDGLMTTFTIEKNKETKITQVVKADFQPTWVNKINEGNNYKYQILICKDVMDGKISDFDTSSILQRIKESYADTIERIGIKSGSNE